jgi:PAS domain S-box-containing protein
VFRLDLSDSRRVEIRREVADRGRWRGEAEVERKDGSRIWVELIDVAIRDSLGQITGYLTIHRDTTERRQAEGQLRYHASLVENMEDAVVATDADDFCITAWNKGAERLYGFTPDEVLGRPARDVASYPGDESRLELERELMEAGRTRIEFTAHRKDGTPIEVELIAVTVKGADGEVTGYLGIHRNITERKRSQQELERRVSQQAAVAELGFRALEDDELQGLRDEASTLVCRGLGVDYGKVDELLADGTGLLVRAGTGWPEGVVGSVVVPTGRRSPAGYALLISQPVIVDDLSVETRFEVPAVLREHAAMSDITVPIETGGRQYGTLAALSKNRRTFSEHDISFVQSLANILATASVRAESEQRLEAAREGERSRIARDLHDGALSELADALALATFARSDPTKERTEAIITSLQGVAHQLRAAAYDLRLPAEEERDFSDRLEELVAVQAGMSTNLEVSLRGGERLPSGSLGAHGTEVLRIVREAITNARRHSGAIAIRLDAGRSTPDVLWLEISDDGAWADREPVVSTRSGTGIRGMFERAEEVGAALKIEGRPDGGSTLSLELPLVTEAGATP